MSVEQQLTDTLTRAIREKDQRTSDVVRMIKTKITERRTAKGAGAIDDAAVIDVIGAYRKQLQKAIGEYEKVGGERAAAQVAQLRFEVEFCERFLPKTMDDAAVRALVKERIGALGITDAKQAGRLIGDVMKTHKGQVDAADVKRVAEELLQG